MTCTPAPRPEPPKTSVAAPPLHEGPLTDYVPAAGLRWLLTGQPRAIAASPAFSESLGLLFPPDRLEAFATGSGVDLRAIERAAIAGFDLGTLYLFEPPEGTASKVVARFRERILSGERSERAHPSIERVSGIIGSTPQMLVHVEERLIAVAVADPTAARIVEAFARKKLRRSPSALHGAALSQLSEPPSGALATFYAPGPFTGEWAAAAQGLLASAVAVSVSVTPSETAAAHLRLELVGDFPASGADALMQAFRDLATSSTGKLLGLDQASSLPRVREREGKLVLEVELQLAPLARGLRAAVIADVWEIMELPAPDKQQR